MKESWRWARSILWTTALFTAFITPTAAGAQSCNGQKIAICHLPPGNPENVRSLCVAPQSWPAHEAHGDSLGFCVPEAVCGESVDLGGGTVEMEVVATGWRITGPFLVSSEGPVTLDPFDCAQVEDQKWSCTWRASGEPGFGSDQSITVRFDQEFSDSFECSLDREAGLPATLIEFAVE